MGEYRTGFLVWNALRSVESVPLCSLVDSCWREQNRPTLCDKQSVCGSASNRVEKEAMCWKSEGEEEEEFINSLES